VAVVAVGIAVIGLTLHLGNELAKENAAFERSFAQNLRISERLDHELDLMFKNGRISYEQLLLYRGTGHLPGIIEPLTAENSRPWQTGHGLLPVTDLRHPSPETKFTPQEVARYAKAYFGRFSETPELARLWERAAEGRGYDAARRVFWRLVNNDRGSDAQFVRNMLDAAGFELQGGTRAPMLRMRIPDAAPGLEAADRRLSIDHIDPQSTHPGSATNPDNLHFELQRENSFRGTSTIEFPRLR
jgi:hypothetical protein